MGLLSVNFSEPLTHWCKLLLLKEGAWSAVPPRDLFPEISLSRSIQHPLCQELLGKAEAAPSPDIQAQYLLQVGERLALIGILHLGFCLCLRGHRQRLGEGEPLGRVPPVSGDAQEVIRSWSFPGELCPDLTWSLASPGPGVWAAPALPGPPALPQLPSGDSLPSSLLRCGA